jgi:hypothetical protein
MVAGRVNPEHKTEQVSLVGGRAWMASCASHSDQECRGRHCNCQHTWQLYVCDMFPCRAQRNMALSSFVHRTHFQVWFVERTFKFCSSNALSSLVRRTHFQVLFIERTFKFGSSNALSSFVHRTHFRMRPDFEGLFYQLILGVSWQV